MAVPVGNAVSPTSIAGANGVIQGSRWSGNQLTYSFWNTNGFYWSASDKQFVRDAFRTYERVANLTFVETSPGGSVFNNASDISIGFGTEAMSYRRIVALGMFPHPQLMTAMLTEDGLGRLSYPTIEGDIWLNPYAREFSDVYLDPGGIGFYVAVHEIGHALGLKHPHDDGGNGAPTYAQLGLSAQNNARWTVMSYNRPTTAYSYGNVATPSANDIAALQAIYGPNTRTAPGNDVYAIRYSDPSPFVTIWDTGGWDMIDAGGMSGDVTVDLRPGTISSAKSRPDYYDSFGIAFGVTVEEGRGGSGNDSLFGSDTGNVLRGASGNDTILGYGGNDLLDGGFGNDVLNGGGGTDTALVYGRRDSHTISRSGSVTFVTAKGAPSSFESLIEVERVKFDDGTLVFGAGDAAGQALRLYRAALGRTPDTAGLAYQVNRMDAGAPLSDMAAGFIASPEFRGKYGALSNEAFVQQLYANVLGRAADAGGLAHHTGALNRGTSRETVLIGFSESPENMANTASLTRDGIWFT